MTPPEEGPTAVDLARRYEEGESIRALASSTGRSYGSIHRALTDAGVQLRPPGGGRTPPAPQAGKPWTVEEEAELWRLAGEYPPKEISRRLGRTTRAVEVKLCRLRGA